MTPRTFRAALFFATALASLLPAGASAIEPRSFGAGSLIIPMDNCWQGDVAQLTASKQTQLGLDMNCAGQSGTSSAYADGARRSYGLVWHLLQAGVPLYWIINPNKANVDDPDFTIDVSSCTSGEDAVRLVDQSMPASACGLDALHPKDSPQGISVSGGCAKYHGAGGPNVAIGTLPLGTAPQSNIQYRGGPFVIDATNAALARDVMAWYYPKAKPPVMTGPLGSGNPRNFTIGAANLAPTDPGAGGLLTSGKYIDPGHFPLHWSQYTPSAMVPMYPANAFNFDISSHTPFGPCTAGLCPFTTWDLMSPDGHVDPWAAMAEPDDEINYSIVNVHQAQFGFVAPVGQLINQPIPPIALAGITDPIHLNTFRFYLEEAGLTFGPCTALPVGWQAPGGGLFSLPIAALVSHDYFFDPGTYPFPDNLVPPVIPSSGVWSQLPAQCSEGIASDDPTFNGFNNLYDGGTPLPPSQGGGPYGKVLDTIAPEFKAFKDLLKSVGSGGALGCGAPRYSQLWIPHWDALTQTGPNTAGDPLASTMDITASPAPRCPVAGPAGSSVLTATGQCPWDPQLVQSIFDDLAVYVAHGGNLLAECIGAASLEDFQFGQTLATYTLTPNPATGVTSPLSQLPTHFMTERDPMASMSAYAPYFFYELWNPGGPAPIPAPASAVTPAVVTQVTALANKCMDDPAGPLATIARTTWNPPATPATVYNPMGYPGSTIASFAGQLATAGTPLGAAAGTVKAWQENTGGGIEPGSDGGTGVHLVEYAPVLPGNMGGGGAKLSDPFLQVGDFYFLGVFGATEAFSESANADAGYPSHGYAVSATNYDTQVLIRGLQGNGTLGAPSPGVNTLFATATPTVNNSVIGDYWVKNHADVPGSGTAVYLQGDSFDGRPDWLRMVWSSILNLSFVPTNREIARSSPTGFVAASPRPGGGYSSTATSPPPLNAPNDWLLQGTFSQASVDYGRYSTTYNSVGDIQSYVFPPERGHLRAADMGAFNTNDSSQNPCFNGSGTVVHGGGAECAAQVGGDAGTNTVSFAGVMQAAIVATSSPYGGWDTAENYPINTTSTQSLLLGSLQGSGAAIGAGPVPQFNLARRTIFSHLYQQVGAGAPGLKLTSLSPNSSDLSKLQSALFPQAVFGTGVLACPTGASTAAGCILGTSACSSLCSSQSSCINGVCGAAPVAAPTAADVAGLLTVVNQSNGGCTPLLADTCYPVNSPQVACLDSCWATCLDTCIPPPTSAGTMLQNTPPFITRPGCQTCAYNCAASCNAGAAGCGGGNCCGVAAATPDVASFRETCFPAIGGVDHSTPVVVAQPPNTFQEAMPGGIATGFSAGCRPTVAYVGAADGMLHAIFLAPGPAFDAAGNACSSFANGTSPQIQPGQELWAFVPNQNLQLLRTGGDCTRGLFVDGVPVVKDVFADLSGSAGLGPRWHTILTETLGQGGNHLFALDVTDPLLPLRTSAMGGYWTGASQINSFSWLNGSAYPFVLWEQGDPLDQQDYQPWYSAGGALTWRGPGISAGPVYSDSPTEGPGFKASPPAPSNATRTFNHYAGGASTVFMGSLVGSGAEQSVTYVAAQQSLLADAYGGAILLCSGVGCTACSGATCNTKDFGQTQGGNNTSNWGILPANPAAIIYGPSGENVYAFDSVTGVPRADSTASGLTPQHFSSLYMASGAPTRSNGNNDIPAPVLGVSTTGKPQTDLLVIPDLDGQVWGLQPSSLASTVKYGALSFPLFDIDRYYYGPHLQSAGGVQATQATHVQQMLQSQAAFANPAAVLPPGSCPGSGSGSTDAIVILATGGVDWGATASVMVALDVNINNFQNGAAGVSAALANDGAAEVIPVGSPKAALELATCQQAALQLPGAPCVGRVFGQPLVVGSTVLYNTNTGVLTGQGQSLDQTTGDGTISSLGNSSCTVATASSNCSICQTTEQSVDLSTGVGKMASGLAAINTGGNVQVFGASATGLSNIDVAPTTGATQNQFQRLSLQQWWLRAQRPTCPSATDPSCAN